MEKLQQRTPTSDLNIIGMCPQAEDLQIITRDLKQVVFSYDREIDYFELPTQ